MVSGPMSRAIMLSGMGWLANDFRQGTRIDAVGDDVIGRAAEIDLMGLRLLQKVFRQRDLIFFHRDFADRLTLRLQKV